jgi:hypothetical protein
LEIVHLLRYSFATVEEMPMEDEVKASMVELILVAVVKVLAA